MILLYTGAQSHNVPQINSNLSLGGYVAATPIPNGRLANLFSSITKSEVFNDKATIRMIALKNTTGAAVTNVKIFTNTVDKHTKLQLAAVASALDVDGNPVFEKVSDVSSLPFQAALDYHEAEENAITIETIAADQIIGIWLLREVDSEKFPHYNTDLEGQLLVDLLNENPTVFEESVTLSISYN